jgi:hypothetical protein
MALKRVHAFGGTFDLTVARDGGQLRLELAADGRAPVTKACTPGDTVPLEL